MGERRSLFDWEKQLEQELVRMLDTRSIFEEKEDKWSGRQVCNKVYSPIGLQVLGTRSFGGLRLNLRSNNNMEGARG